MPNIFDIHSIFLCIYSRVHFIYCKLHYAFSTHSFQLDVHPTSGDEVGKQLTLRSWTATPIPGVPCPTKSLLGRDSLETHPAIENKTTKNCFRRYDTFILNICLVLGPTWFSGSIWGAAPKWGQGGMHERHLMRMEMYADKIEKPVHDRQLGLRWNPLWFQINWNTYTTWIQPILNLVSKNHGSVVSMGWTVFGCSLSYWYSILGWVNHGNHWTSVSCCLLKRSTLQSMLHGITRFFLVKSKILFLISPEWDLCNPLLWHFFWTSHHYPTWGVAGQVGPSLPCDSCGTFHAPPWTCNVQPHVF